MSRKVSLYIFLSSFYGTIHISSKILLLTRQEEKRDRGSFEVFRELASGNFLIEHQLLKLHAAVLKTFLMVISGQISYRR